MARGVLTGTYRGGFDQGSTNRSHRRHRVRTDRPYRGRPDFRIAERVGDVRCEYGDSHALVCIV